MVARGKGGERGVRRGRRGYGAGTHRGGRNASFVASADNPGSKGWQVNAFQPHFSLNEEARNTERHHSWNSDLRLRHSRVAFISAGPSKAEDLTQIPQEKIPGQSEGMQGFFRQESKHTVIQASENLPISQAPSLVPEVALSNMSLSEVPNGTLKMQKNLDSIATVDLSEKGGEDEAMRQGTFFTDTNGSHKPVHTGLPPPIVRRSPSPAISDSSEEIILFAGRKPLQTPADKHVSPLQEHEKGKEIPSHRHSNSMDLSRDPVATTGDDPINSGINSSAPSERAHIYQESSAMATTGPTELSPAPDSRQGLDSAKRQKGHGERRGRVNRGKRAGKAEKEAAIIADYLANICDSDDPDGFTENFALNQRELGDVGADQRQDKDDEVSAPDREFDSLVKGAEEWDSTDLQDFGGLSTSSEALDSIERVVSKRDRSSGVQYLVVGKGSTIDGARWLPVGSLGVPGAERQIRLFEEEQAEFERLLEGSDDSDDSLTNEAKLALGIQEGLDDLEDDRDLEQRRKTRMTDEQIARLLSKQEELGLGANDLMLFKGDDLVEDCLEDTQIDGSWGRRALLRSQPRSTRKKHYGGSFPSATAFADILDQDPYNGFDVMDQERPSLRKRPKGHRGKLTLEISDSELEQSISMAWENDRTKKKIRKQEREELRAQGLLGKTGKLDLAAKYAEGMSMAEVKNEIRDFLLSSTESLPLPPMGQKERKAVHEIANVFKLKSKSIGSGKSRFPVLYRTSRTIQYDEEALSAIEATLSSKRFLPRSDKGKKRGAPPGKARGGGFASAGVSYRDGEVVGATAPELGMENRGRAMLEKMGWSTGTALGALNNNRGIVQPVTQVVKTGKAGLG